MTTEILVSEHWLDGFTKYAASYGVKQEDIPQLLKTANYLSVRASNPELFDEGAREVFEKAGAPLTFPVAPPGGVPAPVAAPVAAATPAAAAVEPGLGHAIDRGVANAGKGIANGAKRIGGKLKIPAALLAGGLAFLGGRSLFHTGTNALAEATQQDDIADYIRRYSKETALKDQLQSLPGMQQSNQQNQRRMFGW